MIVKTEAIVTRWMPYSETSRIVTWITPDHGRIATLVKGSQRPKSAFVGQYDLFYTCELLYYPRERGAVHLAKECSPISTRDRFRSDWRAAVCASYCSDIVTRASPPDAPHPELHALLAHALDDLAEDGGTEAFIAWFDLKLLAALGLAPQMNRCLACGNELQAADRHARFAYARGGILCPSCAGQDKRDTLPISPDVLAALIGWQRAPTPRQTRSTRLTSRQIDAIQNILGLFAGYHLDLPLRSRGIAIDLLRRNLAA
jgi:DNA repair protein RecO (recombination protein O)